jgi:hypothetical protein
LEHTTSNPSNQVAPNAVSFEEFRTEWLADVTSGNPSSTELGRRFAQKLLRDWLDVDDEAASDHLFLCDGKGDGGIDIAYLRVSEEQELGEERTTGDTWFLIQSKYGKAFSGVGTLLEESRKVIETLDGRRAKLSSLAGDVLERLTIFRKQSTDVDRIKLVFATTDPLSENERRALVDVQNMGRARLGPTFDVDAVSVHNIYRQSQERSLVSDPPIKVNLTARLSDSDSGLMVGYVTLPDLYNFLKKYRSQTGDLDQLYEKNVRRFLGSRGKVNREMQKTLRTSPEHFGLYNNGIAIVVTDFEKTRTTLTLVQPYVVNGCQTTRTIWEVFHQRHEAGGSGRDAELEQWKKRAKKGGVIAKIVKVGEGNESLLQEITRFTNTQNTIRQKDFLTLTNKFHQWKTHMAQTWGVFLEVQRGGWDSQKAFQRQNPNTLQFREKANAFDLLKVYGAGWLREPGKAFNRNEDFQPGGAIFDQIIAEADDSPGAFSAEDLYAAHRLSQCAEAYQFGRSAKDKKESRGQTRFLFFAVAIDLLRDVLLKQSVDASNKNITRALLGLFEERNQQAATALFDMAVELIDEYMNPKAEEGVSKEPNFGNNLNGYLKSEQIGRNKAFSPNLFSLLDSFKKSMGRRLSGQPAPRDMIVAALSNQNFS